MARHNTMVEYSDSGGGGGDVCMRLCVGGGEQGLVLFVQDDTPQQHTEMLLGATDSTDGRISEIPQR